MQSFNRNFPCATVTITFPYTQIPLAQEYWTRVVPASCTGLIGGLGIQVEEDRHNLPSFLPFRSCRYTYCSSITEKGYYQATDWVQGFGYTAVYSRINSGNCQMKAVSHFLCFSPSFLPPPLCQKQHLLNCTQAKWANCIILKTQHISELSLQPGNFLTPVTAQQHKH